MNQKPCRGELWMADLEPITGHEQGGKRPCLVLSDDLFNHGPAELVVVLPITSKNREIPLRVPVDPPEGGLKVASYVMPEMIRSISVRRLVRRLGAIGPARMQLVETHVRAVLGLG
jgi:mRNA interferase MazF